MILGSLISVILVSFLNFEKSNGQLNNFESLLNVPNNVASFVGNGVREGAHTVLTGVTSLTKEFIEDARETLSQDWNKEGFLQAFEDKGKEILNKAIKYDKTFNLSPGRDVKFFLYTNSSNVHDGVEIAAGEELARTGFIMGAPVKIICHGFLGHHDFIGPGPYLLPAYIGPHKPPVNVILVDWSKYSGIFIKGDVIPVTGIQPIYFPPARYTETVGSYIADLVTSLAVSHAQGRVGAPVNNIHLIGHSLGAHAVGWAGHYFQQRNGQQLPRITGLDPAAPCFENNIPTVCLEGTYRPISTDDGYFVDIIHTHGRFYGYISPLGHVDFFPNGGMSQPGCSSLGFGICSHFRSIELFAETVNANKHDFVAQKCQGWDQFLNGYCFSTESVQMGEYTPYTARGNFYLKTTGSIPLTAVY